MWLLSTEVMKGINLVILILLLCDGGLRVNSTTQTSTTDDSQKYSAPVSTPLIETESLPKLPTTNSVEIPSIPPGGSTSQGSLQSAHAPSEMRASQGDSTDLHFIPTNKPEEWFPLTEMLTLQTPALSTNPTAAETISTPSRLQSVNLSKRTLSFLQNFTSQKSHQQEQSTNPVGGIGRSPRQTYSSRDATTGPRKPNFETNRQKNWCAYVHTHLLPTAILDNRITSLSSERNPCGWTTESCALRSQRILRPVYRMKHKIVTSLEWKCCPGYSGEECQLKAQQQRPLMHSNQAESHRETLGWNTPRPHQQKDCGHPAEAEKMTLQISDQAMKLTLLQKKVDNISVAMSDMKTMLSSLEEKFSDDQDREIQSVPKGLQLQTVSDLVEKKVKEQFKVFQKGIKETIAQLFNTLSSLSEDLEETRQTVKQVNETVISLIAQQKIIIQENRPTLNDILELKNHIEIVRQEIVFEWKKTIKELEAKQISLQGTLERDHSRKVLYYDSLNKALSKIRKINEHLYDEQVSEQKTDQNAKLMSNVSDYMINLQEKLKSQGLMVLQMYNDITIQENKINNLTLMLEMERVSVREECKEMLSNCRKDSVFHIKDIEKNIHVLNQTLADVLFPMDNKIDKMIEQINDLSYDMEILQPLIEQQASFSQKLECENLNEGENTKIKFENLTSAVKNLSFLINELTKRHHALEAKTQTRDDNFEKIIDNYATEMEDSLNKTMTIMNNAIDSIQDNYVLKETFSINDSSEIHCDCAEKIDAISALIPQFKNLNDSFQILLNATWKNPFSWEIMPMPMDDLEKSGHFSFQRIYQNFNKIAFQILKIQKNLSLLEEKLTLATKISQNCETRFQNMESKFTETLTPHFSLKKGNSVTYERDLSIQIQVLSSRFKTLEAKSNSLSNAFFHLSKTVNYTLRTCHNASKSATEIIAGIPLGIKYSHPEVQILQKNLSNLVESIIETKTQTALANLTWHIEQSLSSILVNTTNIQKNKKTMLRKPSTSKKATVNLTTVIKERAQRNTENAVISGKYSDCSPNPCQNGGTCINGRSDFVCACRHPFAGENCTVKLTDDNALSPDFSKGSYRYAPMVAFFASHTYGMILPGPIRFNSLDVNYGASYAPQTGKFHVPYLGVYVFKYTIESFSPHILGFLVVDGIDKLAFQSENINSERYCDRVVTGDALLELNYGQKVWLRLVKGSIPVRFPPVTTFSGYLLYRT